MGEILNYVSIRPIKPNQGGKKATIFNNVKSSDLEQSKKIARFLSENEDGSDLPDLRCDFYSILHMKGEKMEQQLTDLLKVGDTLTIEQIDTVAKYVFTTTVKMDILRNLSLEQKYYPKIEEVPNSEELFKILVINMLLLDEII